jgi:hypothetical protein
MSWNLRRARRWLIAAVLVHLIVSLVHGAAHAQAHVPLSPEANLFVLTVIVGGPLLGVLLTWRAERIGSWMVALTMAGALVFVVVNHFVRISPDHVSHVDPRWRPLFAGSAVLLALMEAVAGGLAVRLAAERKRS